MSQSFHLIIFTLKTDFTDSTAFLLNRFQLPPFETEDPSEQLQLIKEATQRHGVSDQTKEKTTEILQKYNFLNGVEIDRKNNYSMYRIGWPIINC